MNLQTKIVSGQANIKPATRTIAFIQNATVRSSEVHSNELPETAPSDPLASEESGDPANASDPPP
jgi:hypothetical protein